MKATNANIQKCLDRGHRTVRLRCPRCGEWYGIPTKDWPVPDENLVCRGSIADDCFNRKERCGTHLEIRVV